MVWSIMCALLAAALRASSAQTGPDAQPIEWRAWAFGRAGVGRDGGSDARLASIAGGVAASRGSLLAMIRAAATAACCSDNPPPSVQDYALLAGLRSRGDRLFIAGAAGVARTTDGQSRVGFLTPRERFVPTYELSAHADYLVVGSALTLSGTLGPADTRYIALAFGLELGWFGF